MLVIHILHLNIDGDLNVFYG